VELKIKHLDEQAQDKHKQQRLREELLKINSTFAEKHASSLFEIQAIQNKLENHSVALAGLTQKLAELEET
jgi:hypothetical protein